MISLVFCNVEQPLTLHAYSLNMCECIRSSSWKELAKKLQKRQSELQELEATGEAKARH